MSNSFKRPDQAKPGKKANIPLLLALGGVAISMISESIKDEATSYAAFALGVGCTMLALLYMIFT